MLLVLLANQPDRDPTASRDSTGGRLPVHCVIAVDVAVEGLINLARVRLGNPGTFARPRIDAFVDLTELNWYSYREAEKTMLSM